MFRRLPLSYALKADVRRTIPKTQDGGRQTENQLGLYSNVVAHTRTHAYIYTLSRHLFPMQLPWNQELSQVKLLNPAQS